MKTIFTTEITEIKKVCRQMGASPWPFFISASACAFVAGWEIGSALFALFVAN